MNRAWRFFTPSSHEPPQGNTPIPTLIIRPPKKWVPVDFRELWEYRELLYSFVSRDVKIRYKQTALGFLWAIIQPLFMMVIFTLFFGGFAKIPSDGVPYPLFSFAALLPWTLFSEGLTRSTTSMVSNAGIMTKVYFPRLVMPISGILSPLVDIGFMKKYALANCRRNISWSAIRWSTHEKVKVNRSSRSIFSFGMGERDPKLYCAYLGWDVIMISLWTKNGQYAAQCLVQMIWADTIQR